jgi:predicted histone-like DNA-binding protein
MHNYTLHTVGVNRYIVPKIYGIESKAVERKIKFTKDENDPGVWRYVMQPDLYIALNQAKVIREAALRSGVSQGVMKVCWDAAEEVIKAWATEGHSVALPGLDSMRFGLRAKSVEKVEDVKTSLISSRRIIFTPTQDLKDELASTSIQITCYDRNGDVVKRVTSADAGTVEDNEGDENTNSENGGSQNSQSSEQGEQGQQGQQNQASGYALTISKSGTGTASVTHDGNAVTSGDSLNEDDEVEINITPAEGKVPTASVNGSSIELTEDDGVYTGSFAMPGQASSLVINTGTAEGGDSGDGIDKD